MPLPRKVIDNRNANIEAAPMPTDQELNDLSALAKANWPSFEKALKAGLIVDVTNLLGADKTYSVKEAIKAHGGYFGSLYIHWFVRASEIDALMAEVSSNG